jgi:ring-1,2-phenylacetyl-CoA epoxidase subunit PaaE
MTKVAITLDGKISEVDVPQGTTILDAALDAGLDAPFSCKGGVCTSCMAKVLGGTVEMKANYALTDAEVHKGFVLCCQAMPSSEDVKISWDI